MTVDRSAAEQPLHVLVVDDEAAKIQQSIQQCPGASSSGETLSVEGADFRVHYETDAEAAWNVLTFGDYPVHVVVLDRDFGNAKRDGLWLLREIGHMSVDIPVVVFTQFADPVAAHKAGLLRADRFLDKALFLNAGDPDDIRALFRELYVVCKSKQSQPELHDREHLELADGYADQGYDEGEQAYPATVAYYLFENSRILAAADEFIKSQAEVRICDIGCGTGRIEELLARERSEAAGRLRITAVDFSGRMLRRMREKQELRGLSALRIQRGSAECLSMCESRSFDLVLMAFGVPSYTRYHLSLREAARICRSGGLGLFAVYNEDSAAYEAQQAAGWSADERPIAAVANPETGKLNVGGSRDFDCETFSVDAFTRLLRRFGFLPERTETFPTLHSVLPRSAVARISDSAVKPEGFPHCRLFSKTLYELDLQVSAVNQHRGHYILVRARRV